MEVEGEEGEGEATSRLCDCARASTSGEVGRENEVQGEQEGRGKGISHHKSRTLARESSRRGAWKEQEVEGEQEGGVGRDGGGRRSSLSCEGEYFCPCASTHASPPSLLTIL